MSIITREQSKKFYDTFIDNFAQAQNIKTPLDPILKEKLESILDEDQHLKSIKNFLQVLEQTNNSNESVKQEIAAQANELAKTLSIPTNPLIIQKVKAAYTKYTSSKIRSGANEVKGHVQTEVIEKEAGALLGLGSALNKQAIIDKFLQNYEIPDLFKKHIDIIVDSTIIAPISNYVNGKIFSRPIESFVATLNQNNEKGEINQDLNTIRQIFTPILTKGKLEFGTHLKDSEHAQGKAIKLADTYSQEKAAKLFDNLIKEVPEIKNNPAQTRQAIEERVTLVNQITLGNFLESGDKNLFSTLSPEYLLQKRQKANEYIKKCNTQIDKLKDKAEIQLLLEDTRHKYEQLKDNYLDETHKQRLSRNKGHNIFDDNHIKNQEEMTQDMQDVVVYAKNIVNNDNINAKDLKNAIEVHNTDFQYALFKHLEHIDSYTKGLESLYTNTILKDKTYNSDEVRKKIKRNNSYLNELQIQVDQIKKLEEKITPLKQQKELHKPNQTTQTQINHQSNHQSSIVEDDITKFKEVFWKNLAQKTNSTKTVSLKDIEKLKAELKNDSKITDLNQFLEFTQHNPQENKALQNAAGEKLIRSLEVPEIYRALEAYKKQEENFLNPINNISPIDIKPSQLIEDVTKLAYEQSESAIITAAQSIGIPTVVTKFAKGVVVDKAQELWKSHEKDILGESHFVTAFVDTLNQTRKENPIAATFEDILIKGKKDFSTTLITSAQNTDKQIDIAKKTDQNSIETERKLFSQLIQQTPKEQKALEEQINTVTKVLKGENGSGFDLIAGKLDQEERYLATQHLKNLYRPIKTEIENLLENSQSEYDQIKLNHLDQEQQKNLYKAEQNQDTIILHQEIINEYDEKKRDEWSKALDLEHMNNKTQMQKDIDKVKNQFAALKDIIYPEYFKTEIQNQHDNFQDVLSKHLQHIYKYNKGLESLSRTFSNMQDLSDIKDKIQINQTYLKDLKTKTQQVEQLKDSISLSKEQTQPPITKKNDSLASATSNANNRITAESLKEAQRLLETLTNNPSVHKSNESTKSTKLKLQQNQTLVR